MSQTIYLDSVALGQSWIGASAGGSLQAITASGSLTSASVTITLAGGAAGVYAFSGEANFPNSADWPAASSADPYKAVVNVTAIGADITLTNTNSGLNRLDFDLFPSLAHINGTWDSTTGTGLKTVSNTSVDPAAGSAADRLGVVIQSQNANSMKSETMTLALGTTSTFAQGPWASTPPPVSGSFTANAVIKKSLSGSFTANAILRKTAVAGSSPSTAWVVNNQGSSVFNGRVAYGNGYWVSAIQGFSPGHVLYAISPANAWTDKTFGFQFVGVFFYNGYFYAVGNDSSLQTAVWRTTDPSGTWTDVSPAVKSGMAWHIGYGNGLLILLAVDGSNNLWMWTSTDGVNWTRNTGHGITTLGSYGDTGGFIGFDGTYFALLRRGELWYTTDPTGAWTKNTSESTSATSSQNIVFRDGYWVYVPSASGGFRYRTGDPTGAFTEGSTPFSPNSPQWLANGNGYWGMIGPFGKFAYAVSPNGSWSRNDGPSAGNDPTSVAVAGGVWIATNSAGTLRYLAGPILADAIIRKTQTGSVSLDAVITAPTHTGSFTANAVLQKTQAASATIDAVIRRTSQGSLTVDASIARTQTFAFVADAVVRRSQQASLTADAIVRRSISASFAADAVIATATVVTASFTADAVLKATLTGALTLDAKIIRRTTASLTADAILRKTISGTATIDASIVNRKFGTLAADAVLFATQQSSFKARAVIRVPTETGTHIRVNGADITDDVLFADAQFTTLVNGAPGTFKFKVKDTDQTRSFSAGDEITLDIDGVRRFGGYLSTPSRSYFFDVDDTQIPTLVARVLTLTGWDYNILFGKRVVYDKSVPKNVLLRSWPAGSRDDDVIKYVFDHYTDLAGDSVSYDRVEHVGSPNPDAAGVVGSGGLYFGDLMHEINRLIGGIWYISPDKDLTFTDVDTPNASVALSDHPVGGEIGYREFSHTENGVKLANDAMVWGAGLGSNKMVRARTQDLTSIAAHGRWQYGEFTTQLYKQASVQKRADTVVYGTPQNKRGGKDDQVSWQLVTYDKSFVVGQKVAIESEVFGVSDVVPIRRMTISWPTSNRDKPKFDITLSHEIDEPWNSFEFFFPGFPGFPTIVIPDITVDGFPPNSGTVILDDFDRQLTENPGCASSGYLWQSPAASDPSLVIDGRYRLDYPTNTAVQWTLAIPYDPRNAVFSLWLELFNQGNEIFPGHGVEFFFTVERWEGATLLDSVEFEIQSSAASSDNPSGATDITLTVNCTEGRIQTSIPFLNPFGTQVVMSLTDTAASLDALGTLVSGSQSWATPTNPDNVVTILKLRTDVYDSWGSGYLRIDTLTGVLPLPTSATVDTCP